MPGELLRSVIGGAPAKVKVTAYADPGTFLVQLTPECRDALLPDELRAKYTSARLSGEAIHHAIVAIEERRDDWRRWPDDGEGRERAERLDAVAMWLRGLIGDPRWEDLNALRSAKETP